MNNLLPLVPWLLTLGVFAPLAPKAEATQDITALVFKVSLVALFILIFTVAPYQLYKKEHLRANKAEERLIPKISLSVGNIGEEGGRFAICVNVKNLGTEPLFDCVGQLRRVYFERPNGMFWDRDIAPRQLMWSERYYTESPLAHTVHTEAEIVLAAIPPPSAGPQVPTVFIGDFNSLETVEVPSVFEIEVAANNSSAVVERFYYNIEPIRFRKYTEPIQPPDPNEVI